MNIALHFIIILIHPEGKAERPTYTVYGIQRKGYSYTTNIAVRSTLDIYTCLERIGEIGDISDEVYP